ncbi:lipid kinase [Aggregicoccus sp. 17bor-14]|nr:lipid kinase [Simulacricoccus sp. 17bor-14]MRI87514.1 lipid kinase [Aggregicoccus sp. 17bor-14]
MLLVNTRSRSGREAFEQAQALLAERGVALTEALAVTRPQRLPKLVDAALAAGARRVLVGGGDGTLSCAAARLVGRDAVLGVLPLGTANDFARNLGLAPTLEAACDAIARGFTVKVDVGLANGRPFLNAASLGLASAIAKRLTKELKQKAGKLAYPVAAAAEAWGHEAFRVRLRTVEGETLDSEVLQLVVGNGRYHGAGNVVSPDGTLDDRRLDVYAVVSPACEAGQEDTGLGHLRDLGTLASIALKLKKGEHVEHPQVVTLRTRGLELSAEPVQDVNADGELVGQTPMRFEVQPGALRVYAPERH